MPWAVPQPLETWSDREQNAFDLEVFRRFKFGAFAWTPPLVGPGVTTDFLVAASGSAVISTAPTGLRVGNPVSVTAPGVIDRLVTVQARVTASDTLTVTIANGSGGNTTAPAGNWSFIGVVL